MQSSRPSRLGRLAGTLIVALVRFLGSREDPPRADSPELDPPLAPDPRRIAAGALLRQLDRSIQAWEVEFRSFLHGDRHHAPLELTATIEETFREILALGVSDKDQTFLLESLEWRFGTAKRRFGRLLARRERPAGAVAAPVPRPRRLELPN